MANGSTALKKEAYLSITLFVVMCLFLAALYYGYRRDVNIWSTSKEREVMVTGKHKGTGKRDRRRIYIKDGPVNTEITTTARWYFETSVGQKTIARYSSVYNAYRQPYHVAGREIYLFWYCLPFTLFFLGRGIWLFQKIRLADGRPSQD